MDFKRLEASVRAFDQGRLSLYQITLHNRIIALHPFRLRQRIPDRLERLFGVKAGSFR